jgi:hypothetical protein
MRISYEKARNLRSGQMIWRVMVHVHVNRFVTPYTERIEAYADAQYFKGKRTHHEDWPGPKSLGQLLNGTYGGYFTTKKQAEAFVQEILDGLHPSIISAAREYGAEMDYMDECMGICNRGFGFYECDLESDYMTDPF